MKKTGATLKGVLSEDIKDLRKKVKILQKELKKKESLYEFMYKCVK